MIRALPSPVVPPFDLAFHELATLKEEQRLLLIRMIATGILTSQQAQDAIDIHRDHLTPLLDILGARAGIRPRQYAEHLAAVTGIRYVSDLVGSDALSLDREFVVQFNPTDLTRELFCPLTADGAVVRVLAVDPTNPNILELVQAVVPDAELSIGIGTEVDVTWLVANLFRGSLLDGAVHELRLAHPEQSAARVFSGPQIIGFAILSVAMLGSIILFPLDTVKTLMAIVSVFFAVSILYKLSLSVVGLLTEHREAAPTPSSERIPDHELPIYSILVPVYREPEVIPILLAALGGMDYPSEKLDVLLLLEADDLETIASAKAARPPAFVRFIYIPPSQPRTKPKACNYGLDFARGEYVTIYDAEDIPDPGQLRKAVHAFRVGGDDLVCVQAALNYFNARENYLTRMFTLEYTYWFDTLLPGLDRLGLPIPLGGTSNHFNIDKLRKLGAWDPFNVTEDADLGIRASAEQLRVGVIESTTMEEACKKPKIWLKQRSRWIKGYMQTWLVHNRSPFQLLSAIGFKSWVSYQLFIGGAVLTFLAQPWLWAMLLVWLVFRPYFIDDVFDGWLFYISAVTTLTGTFAGVYLNILAAVRRNYHDLALYALTNPLYWCMHSIAAHIALWQLFTKPFYWEKTTHGLTTFSTHALLNKVNPSAGPSPTPPAPDPRPLAAAS
ncbi:MAG: glycosyltransferase [Chloroflexota bacterium]